MSERPEVGTLEPARPGRVGGIPGQVCSGISSREMSGRGAMEAHLARVDATRPHLDAIGRRPHGPATVTGEITDVVDTPTDLCRPIAEPFMDVIVRAPIVVD